MLDIDDLHERPVVFVHGPFGADVVVPHATPPRREFHAAYYRFRKPINLNAAA